MLTIEERSRFAGGLDFDAFDRLCQSAKVSPHKLRLVDFDRQIERACDLARDLGLDRAQPLDILEIGSGPGYFLHVCRTLGHNVTGIDRPSVRLFPDVCAWLGLATIDYEVKPNQRLPVSGKFDLIAAFRCPFHYVRADDRFWTEAEWAFFLDHLRDDLLKSGGRFALDIRKQSADSRTLSKIERAMLDDLLQARGGKFATPLSDTNKAPLMVFDPLL